MSSSRFQQFVSELRRRHVVRVALGYLAAVFVVLQVADVTLPAFGQGDQAVRVLVVMAGLGFPVVLALSWLYDLTRSGIQRTEGSDEPTSTMLLPRLVLLGITALSVGLAGWWWVRSEGVAPAAEGRPSNVLPAATAIAADGPIRSLAVLPFDDFSNQDEPDYFAAGMHEAVISQLSRLSTVRVVSRTSVMQYQGTTKTIPEIGGELRVEGVVEGSVLRAGNQVRITVQLIHAGADRHVWANSYDGDMSDVLALQAEVAAAIASEIQSALVQSPIETVAGRSADPEAQDAYLQGRYEQSKGTPEALDRAAEYFERAIELDPEFAEAYARLAGARVLRSVVDGAPDPVLVADAQEAAATAVSIDSQSIEARVILSTIEGISSDGLLAPGMTLRIPGVRTSPAVDPAPTVPEAPAVGTAEFDEAWATAFTEFGKQFQVIRAQRSTPDLDRLPPDRRLQVAKGFEIGGDVERASAVLEALIEQRPDIREAWAALEELHLSAGNLDQVIAIERARHERAAEEGTSHAAGEVDELEAAIATEGRLGYWRWKLSELGRLEAGGESVAHSEWALAHANQGDLDPAFERLRLALRDRERRLLTLPSDPGWDPLRADPRFAEILSRVRELPLRGRPSPSR